MSLSRVHVENSLFLSGSCERDGESVCPLQSWGLALVSGFLRDTDDTGRECRHGREILVQIPAPPLPFGATWRRCSRSLDLRFVVHQTGRVSPQ